MTTSAASACSSAARAAHPVNSRPWLAALFASVALAGCGGSSDSSPAPSPPAPAASTSATFATPSSASATSEAGSIESYAFAEKAGEQSAGAVQYASGVASYSAVLSGAQAYAGAALRLYAPRNTGAAPVTAFDASGYTKLHIQLKSSTDATLTLKLQPSPVAGDGCTATAQALVDATMAELVIDLTEARFPLPDYCNGAGSKLAAVQPRLYAIDVINPATSAGTHDLAVGRVTLSK